jgi:SAM-dependent methyltransferase
MGGAGDHWSDIARRWEQVGSPLRPVDEDLTVSAALIDALTGKYGRAPRALILGVTAELYHLPWPAGTDLLAVDHTQAMIDSLWPGAPGTALCAAWQTMPLPDSSRDLVLCDGGATLLEYPREHRMLVANLRRILSPGGLCAFRLYVPPATREAPEAVLDDLLQGRIANLNVLKLRLGMAMQEHESEGVELAAVWRKLSEAAPDLRALAVRIGWDPEHLLAIETYRDCAFRYRFLRVETIQSLFTVDPGGFECLDLRYPRYALGERCPTIVLRRSGG